MIKNCYQCRKDFETDDRHKRDCPECVVKDVELSRAHSEKLKQIEENSKIAAKRAEEAARENWIAETLPPGFLRHDGIPPGVDSAGMQAALTWFDLSGKDETYRNLYLHGPSGIGKTWTCNAIIKAAAATMSGWKLNAGQIVRTDGTEFQREIPARLSRNKKKNDDNTEQGTLDEYLHPLQSAPLLIFDELDKLKGTPRVCVEFFSLLNLRIEQEQQTILASFGSPIVVARLFEGATDKQLGIQVARRLLDFFAIIELKKDHP